MLTTAIRQLTAAVVAAGITFGVGRLLGVATN
jgi:VIT1/CCC1 family predicted Fe2+/Mn2+ transporter